MVLKYRSLFVEGSGSPLLSASTACCGLLFATAGGQRLLSAGAICRCCRCFFSSQHIRLNISTDTRQDLGYRRVMCLHDGDGVVVRHVVVEAGARCAVSNVSQHVAVRWSVVKTDNAVVDRIIDVARLVDQQ